MRNYNQTRFEKEITSEPNKVGELHPKVQAQTDGWDSLKEVPFRGNQNAIQKATVTREASGGSASAGKNAFTRAHSSAMGSSVSSNQQRSR